MSEDDDENVEGVYVGVLSIVAIIRPVSLVAEKSIISVSRKC